MKYAYYRDRENNITNHHEIPEEWTEEEVEEKVKQFNSTGDLTSFVIEVEEGSFIEYLINRLEEKPNYERDVLQEMIDHLEDVIDFLEEKEKRLTQWTENGASLDLGDPKSDMEARQALMVQFKKACNKLAELEDKLEEGK